MKKIPTYTFDYSLPADRRWDALPQYLRSAGRVIARNGIEDLAEYKAVGPVALAFRLFTKGRNSYRGEIKGAARVLGVPYNDAVALNYLYEASQVLDYGCKLWEGKLGDKLRGMTDALNRHMAGFRKGVLACTAGVRHVDGLGMTHVRSMDWPVEGLGRHTLILRHINNPAGDFYSVGFPGYSGVLSGFKPGAFSATINMAPVVRMPNLHWPPAHLLRWVFENCRTYVEALSYLRNSPVCVPAFVLLASPDKAAVVELGPDGNKVKPMKGGVPIAIANDYLGAKRRKETGAYGETTDSDRRRNALLRRIGKLKRGTIQQAMRLLQVRPIQHFWTMQQMVFAHGTGTMAVIGREDDRAVAQIVL